MGDALIACLIVGEAGADTLTSTAGVVLKASLRCRCDPFWVCRSLCRAQRSARTKLRGQPGWSHSYMFLGVSAEYTISQGS
jgi:hypothetical protein